MASERLTSQKRIILDYLQSVKTHPSAEIIFKDVRKKLPSLSLATVYRILNNFSSKGLVLEIPSETKRFDADISDHDHFICNKCHKIYDIYNKKKKFHKKIKNVGTVLNQQTYFYGICKKCN